MEVRKKHWTTTIGQAAGHPAAFAIVLSYAGLWLTFMPQHLNAVATLAVWVMTLFIQRSKSARHSGPSRKALHLLSKYTVKVRSRSRMSIRPMTRVSSRDSVHKHKPCRLIVSTAKKPIRATEVVSNEGPVQRRAFSVGRYFTRRPLKKPAFVVFYLILAVSPCSAIFTSAFFAMSLLTSALSPVPLWLRFAGGTGGISL